jgi:hypothetical protein
VGAESPLERHTNLMWVKVPAEALGCSRASESSGLSKNENPARRELTSAGRILPPILWKHLTDDEELAIFAFPRKQGRELLRMPHLLTTRLRTATGCEEIQKAETRGVPFVALGSQNRSETLYWLLGTSVQKNGFGLQSFVFM